ncbi:MAG: hypothetical protein Sapg2KO_02320 [Saprospiraceae bacterium]
MKKSFFDFEIIKVPENDFSPDELSGNNQKGLILLFAGEETEKEELLTFLAKVFQAIQVDLNQDTYYINHQEQPDLNWPHFLQKNKVQSVVIFGLLPEVFGIRFALPPYTLIEHQNIQYLRVDDLTAIYEERQNGGKKMSGLLWRAIQQLKID